MSNSPRWDLTRSAVLLTILLIVPISATAAAPVERPNVLMIAVDDLRPELGCYGCTQIRSPHIDELASRGLVFERAYCQQAICMPSRASLMSGYRPDQGRLYICSPLYARIPDALSLNKHFLANGYETATIGKVYHHRRDEEEGWSIPAWHPEGAWVGRGYLTPEGKKIALKYDERTGQPVEGTGTMDVRLKAVLEGLGPAFEHPDVADNAYPDGMIADRAIEELGRVREKPFFLAVGFHKPHLPFNAPQKYWDLYDHDAIELADNPNPPQGAPRCALTDWGELRVYYDGPKTGDVPADQARDLIHAYYGCVSYIDAQIGKVLDELERRGLKEKTIVVLWGDHGWKLGEHGMWSKGTNFELDTRSTLILHVPGMKAAGGRTRALVEFVDIYPTLCELCGLELPPHLEGISMVPLLDDPDRPWKRAAFSQFPHPNPLNVKAMGYSMRTDRYRYTEWRDLKTGEAFERELYDHQTDPDENTNVAEDPANQELIARLRHMLHEGYEAAKP